ncbi:unnamed protein product [Adineta steineri]|uniref:RTA1-like protein n=1 Tax=Adineta steineri TaxID=433720 RepID=A0A818HA37_9BILA|nr:unnamed protein product [Adineta steineri]CAF3505041.1 unnamed protein product [Adineta steineri]
MYLARYYYLDWSQTPFKYDPSIPAASILLAAFLITTIVHTVQIILSKTWYLIPIVICGIMEVVGFACRIASRQSPNNVSLYSAQYAFLVLAPIFLAASVYITLGRIIRFVGHPSLISAKKIAIIFVVCDIISFIVQAIGAAVLLNRSNTTNLTIGKDILLAGLIIQIVTFAFFTICAVHYDVVVYKSGQHGGRWRWSMRALYVVCALILARSIFRVIEFSEDTTGYLQTTEWPIYIFDAVFIFLSMVIFNIIHPSRYLVEDQATPNLKSVTPNEAATNKTPVVSTKV